MGNLITTPEIVAKYGKPGDVSNLTIIALPYPMKIAWDPTHITQKIQCHKLVVNQIKGIFSALLKEYGLKEIQRLEIDLYGGCYNFRQMRGGTEWSRHSWGIAIDLDPGHNRLKQTSKTARFAKRDYVKMIDIFYQHDFVSLGREKNYDWMHFQVR